MSAPIPPFTSDGGIFFGLPDKEYRAAEGISQSSLKHISRSPAYFQCKLKEPKKHTPATLLGTIVHHLILTPKLPPFWTVKPEGLKLSTKEGKAWKEKHPDEDNYVSFEDFQDAQGMAASVLSIPESSEALALGESEVSVFSPFNIGGDFKDTTVMRKCRIDRRTTGVALVDIKTCEDAREKATEAAILERGYHIQAASNLDTINHHLEFDKHHTDFVIIAVEKSPPYDLIVHWLTPECIAKGRETYLNLMNEYVRCVATNSWPGYNHSIRRTGLPAWAMK